MSENYPQLAQGPAKPATSEDLERDASGITNPNLHRRIDNSPIEITGSEYVLSDQDDYILCNQQDEELLINFYSPFSPSEPTIALNSSYILNVAGVNSYRTTNTITHEEESTDSEIP
jgi:hypothetical protein